MENSKNFGNTNQGYFGEPADQHITSRSLNNGQTQGGFYESGQEAVSQSSIQMQAIGQPSQGHLQYMVQPPQYGFVSNNDQNSPQAYGLQKPAPGYQYIVRDSFTPMPEDEENGGPTYLPSFGGIIFKRIVSALLIILDVSLDWLQFASWVGHFELPAWLSLVETVKSLKEKSPLKAQCGEGSIDLTTTYGVFVAIGTAYACLRLVNMVGETILEYQLRNTSETESGCRGFQILHGWVETVLSFLCDDLPQAILLTLFSLQCTINWMAMTKIMFFILIKSFKNGFRVSSCKQKYKPCCQDICKNCCAYVQDFPCVCRVFIFRPFGCCCDADCVECEQYEMCPDCACKRDGRCFGNIEKDPKWALRNYDKLQDLFFFLLTAILTISILKNLAILPKRLSF